MLNWNLWKRLNFAREQKFGDDGPNFITWRLVMCGSQMKAEIEERKKQEIAELEDQVQKLIAMGQLPTTEEHC